MLDFTGPIFVYTCPVDMRKSIDGLSILISDFISQPITGINNPVESSEPINVTVNDASLIFLFIIICFVSTNIIVLFITTILFNNLF